MNINALIAVLVIKNIITREEGDELVSYLNDKPQSTVLRDAIANVSEFVTSGVSQGPLIPQLGPVGPAQHAEEMAARTQPVVLEPALAAPAGSPEPSEPQNPTPNEPALPEGGESYEPSPVKKTTDKPKKK